MRQFGLKTRGFELYSWNRDKAKKKRREIALPQSQVDAICEEYGLAVGCVLESVGHHWRFEGVAGPGVGGGKPVVYARRYFKNGAEAKVVSRLHSWKVVEI